MVTGSTHSTFKIRVECMLRTVREIVRRIEEDLRSPDLQPNEAAALRETLKNKQTRIRSLRRRMRQLNQEDHS